MPQENRLEEVAKWLVVTTEPFASMSQQDILIAQGLLRAALVSTWQVFCAGAQIGVVIAQQHLQKTA